MPAKTHMTWVASGRRWTKKHAGKWYAVSCKKLGVPETKEASWRAANEWWEATRKGVDSATTTEEDRKVNAFRVWSMVQDWGRLDEASREKLVDSLVGAGQYQKLKGQAEAVVGAAAEST